MLAVHKVHYIMKFPYSTLPPGTRPSLQQLCSLLRGFPNSFDCKNHQIKSGEDYFSIEFSSVEVAADHYQLTEANKLIMIPL